MSAEVKVSNETISSKNTNPFFLSNICQYLKNVFVPRTSAQLIPD